MNSTNRINLKEIERLLGIKKPDNWYNIKNSQAKYRSLNIKKQYLLYELQIAYPQKFWKIWLLPGNNPLRYFDKQLNQRNFLEDCSKKLKIKTAKDWYDVKSVDVNTSTNFVKKIFNSSVQNSLITLFPEHYGFLHSWKFIKVPRRFWESHDNQKFFLDEIARTNRFKKIQDWYKISFEEIMKSSYMYNEHKSVIGVLKFFFPHHIWVPWKFSPVRAGIWDDERQGKYFRRQCLDSQVTPSLSIVKMDDWYNKLYSDFVKCSGGSTVLVHKYNSNLLVCMNDLYPEINWIPWKFWRLPPTFWEKKENVYQFLTYCENFYSIKSKQEWRFMNHRRIEKLGGSTLLKIWNGLYGILNKYYPQENWQILQTKNQKNLKNQFHFVNYIRKIFDDQKIEINFKHPELSFKDTNKKIELDVFLPGLNLAFEYQGEQHYEFTGISGHPKNQIDRDTEKRELCFNNSISLIEIPYWINWSEEYFFEMLKEKRPDLFKKYKK